jgi:hypothetical protein
MDLALVPQAGLGDRLRFLVEQVDRAAVPSQGERDAAALDSRPEDGDVTAHCRASLSAARSARAILFGDDRPRSRPTRRGKIIGDLQSPNPFDL